MKKIYQKAAAMMSSLMVLSAVPPASMREITRELEAIIKTSYKYDSSLQGTPVCRRIAGSKFIQKKIDYMMNTITAIFARKAGAFLSYHDAF